jgi:hypothetical protein
VSGHLAFKFKAQKLEMSARRLMEDVNVSFAVNSFMHDVFVFFFSFVNCMFLVGLGFSYTSGSQARWWAVPALIRCAVLSFFELHDVMIMIVWICRDSGVYFISLVFFFLLGRFMFDRSLLSTFLLSPIRL